jgi:N-methylhydantoinase A/oxoprolinase/acetone carboxylase beta subunit
MTVVRVHAYVPGPAVDLTRRLPAPYEESVGPGEYRAVYWYELGGETQTPIYDGDELQSGMAIFGPAIIEFPFTSAVVRPGQSARMDVQGNLVLALVDPSATTSGGDVRQEEIRS